MLGHRSSLLAARSQSRTMRFQQWLIIMSRETNWKGSPCLGKAERWSWVIATGCWIKLLLKPDVHAPFGLCDPTNSPFV